MAVGLAKENAYFAGLSEALAAKRDRLSAGLRGLGFGVLLPAMGSYFVTADFAPLGYRGDDVAFCRYITEHAAVAAIPVSAFYESDAPGHYARFAFCKREEVLDEAVSRLRRHFASPAWAAQTRAAAPAPLTKTG